MLDGLTVVEVAGGVATAWCGRLLAQLGSAVTVLEPPEGSPLRTRPPLLPGGESPWHHWLNGEKTSVAISGDDAVGEAARGADVVIWPATGAEEPGSVEALAAGLRTTTPHQVFVALSPFGLTGPWRALASSDLVEWAAGGHLYLTGDRNREPVQGGGPWPGYVAGSTAAVGAVAALLDAGVTGAGQLVDVGTMEAMAAAHQWTISTYTHHGYVKRRDGNRLAESYHPIAIYRCRDGWVQVAAASREQWEAVCLVSGCVELLADDDLLVAAGRYDRADEIDAAIGPWFAASTIAEAVAQLQEARVPASVVNDLATVVRDPQLEARGYWSSMPSVASTAVVPGPPIVVGPRVPPGPVSAAPVPRVGSRSGSRQARAALPAVDLSGVRVLEFGVAWAGPLAGRFLADLGADVIKVEHPTSRGLAVEPGGEAEGWRWGELPPASVRNGTWPAGDPGARWFNRMGMFNKLQRNKRSLCLDAKAPGGTDVLHRLVERSDVVLNNYSPRGVRSLGIDHETLSVVNPDIVTVSMSGYGATGPMASHFSFGPILETHAGLASTTGYPDGGPLRVGVAFPDPVGGVLGALAVLVGLWHRAATGSGAPLDVSQLETLLPFVGDQILVTSITGDQPDRLGNRSASFAPQGVYRCDGDDAWLALTVRSDGEWERLVDLIGSDAEPLRQSGYRTVEGRRADHDRIDAELTRWTSRRGKFEAMAALQHRGIAAMAVLTNADLVDGPQLAARGFIATIDSADAGPQRLPGSPLHFSTRTIPMGPAPTLGEHNADIVGGLLGYDDAAIAELIAAGALADAPPP